MGALAGFIGSIFSGFIGWLSAYLGKRLAVTLAVVAAFTAATATFWAAAEALVFGLAVSVPADVVTVASWIVPPNLAVCIGALLSARLVRFAYDWNVRVLQFKVNI